MSPSRCLVLGTHNRKKGLELASLLQPHGFELSTLGDFSDALDVVEDGTTFTANARLKASQQAGHLKRWVLAEDSGLSVDVLDGAPGVYSARYAGPDATDETNMDMLLQALADVPLERRTARYVCHLSLADPAGVIRLEVEAYCRGRIALQRHGAAGFGYDPLFEVREYHRTFGQLGEPVKSMLSHRGRAIRQLAPQLVSLANVVAWAESE